MAIDRNDLNSLLYNGGQNEIGPNILNFSLKVDKIESINDNALLCKLFKEEIKRDRENKVLKFERTSEEIFKDKIWSGCSDVATALTPILRLKGVPTIYVQSADINWIKDLNNKIDGPVYGHIFLEIYLNNEWMLLDPTNEILYLDYDFNNLYLPNNYYAFSKSLNGHELGHISLKENNRIMKEMFLNNNIESNNVIKYKEINLKEMG